MFLPQLSLYSDQNKLDDPVNVNNPNVQPTESSETGTSPIQFEPISTPLSFLLEAEVDSELVVEVDSELVDILIPTTFGWWVLDPQLMS